MRPVRVKCVAHVPTDLTRRTVRLFVRAGVQQLLIAEALGVNIKTLTKYYDRELKLGTAEANAAVAACLYRQATDPVKPNVVAAIFWLKCRGNWREVDVHKHELSAEVSLTKFLTGLAKHESTALRLVDDEEEEEATAAVH